MKIAVDVMGAEKGVNTVIEACFAATEEGKDIEIILVGKKEKIKQEIEKINLQNLPFPIVDAPEIIKMEDSVSDALNKKNSSISIGIELVKSGKAQAFVSAGNTGAVMACCLLKLGKIKGIVRPCLAATFPTFNGKKVVLVDVGANVDCKPAHLFQFGLLGSIYARKVLEIKNPKVALLNIGSEETKGNDVTLETYRLLKRSSLNFVGNVEGKDITSGKVDVVVCDGFVGNIILKFAEGFASATLAIVERKTKESMPEAGKLVKKELLKKIGMVLDYAEYGGVPLLGVKGICVVAHGASSSKAIKNAIITAYRFCLGNINSLIEKAFFDFTKRQKNERPGN